MTFFEIYAFFLNPLLVAALGVGAAWLHIWDAKRREQRDTHHPAE